MEGQYLSGFYIFVGVLIVVSAANVCVYETCFCRGTYVDCKYKHLAAVPRLSQGNCSLCTVDVSDNQITDIQDGQLPAGLRALKSRWNPLSHLSDHALRDSADTLEELDLTSGNLTSIPVTLTDLRRLNYLTISGHRLVNADNSTAATTSLAVTRLPVDYLPVTLRWVFLDDNCLTSVPATVTSLPLLQQLDVSGNRITSVDDATFPSHVTTLHLSRNLIRHVHALRFTNATRSSMVTLELRDNPIQYIADHVFDPLTSLRILDLGGTQLLTLPLALLPLTSVGAIGISNSANLTCTCAAAPLRHLRFNGDCIYFFKEDQSRRERISDFLGRDVDRCPSTTPATPTIHGLSVSSVTATSASVTSATVSTTTHTSPTHTCHGSNHDPGEFFDVLDTGVKEWRLAFRGVAGNNQSVYSAYMTSQPHVNNDCRQVPGIGCCSSHYRNNALLDAWAGVEEVLLAVYKGIKRVAHVVFDAKGSNSTSWMSGHRVVNSSWSDIATNAMVGEYFSLAGDVTEARHFLMSHAHADCGSDAGWLVAVDRTDNVTCPWEYNRGFPMFFFARSSTFVNWMHGAAQRATLMAVFVREGTGVVG